jgi:hypothetical protein
MTGVNAKYFTFFAAGLLNDSVWHG